MEQELGVLLDPIGSDAKRCKVLRTARAGGDPVLLASHAAIFDIPSYVDVPLPISSKIIKLLLDKLLTMLAVSFISTIKVDSPELILSDAPTLVKILSKIPISAFSAGTKQPNIQPQI